MKQDCTGRHFWTLGYCVSTVGLDEVMIFNSIKNQELEEKRQEQIRLAGGLAIAPSRGGASYRPLCGWLLISSPVGPPPITRKN